MYRYLLRPLLWRLSPESAHGLAMVGLRLCCLIPGVCRLLRGWNKDAFDARLAVNVGGVTWPNPIGLAAGFDKDARAIDAIAALGFGCVEVGSVTERPQPGNPKPRLFRLKQDRALVNRLGFNNAGMHAARTQLERSESRPVGVNLGKNKDVSMEASPESYAQLVRHFAGRCDYIVINVSSPNTPGLRRLQGANALCETLRAVRGAMHVPTPLFLKVAPDLGELDFDTVIDLALQEKLSGLVIANTTVARDGLRSSPDAVEDCGAGGLSGAPLKRRSLQMLQHARARVGTSLALISVGGVEDVEDVWIRLRAGASAVQLYTALVYEGPGLAARLCRGLLERLELERFDSIAALQASAADAADSGARAVVA